MTVCFLVWPFPPTRAHKQFVVARRKVMFDVCECASLKPGSRAVDTQLASKFLHQFCSAQFQHSLFTSALLQGDFPNGSCGHVTVAAHELKNRRRTSMAPRRLVVRHDSLLFTHACIYTVCGVSLYFASVAV